MDVLNAVPKRADHRIRYGVGSEQFGDLRLPVESGDRPAPLVVFLHGGWWQSQYDLEYGGHLCEALKADGIATWSLEYRRVGATGGGWPTTFQDVAMGYDYTAELARHYPVDLQRVFTMGHSAGGHLAFWLAGRHHIDAKSPLHEPQPKVTLRGVIGLAAVVDLRLTIDLSGWLTFSHDKHEVYGLMGGNPTDFEDRYRAGNPGDLLPLSVRQLLIQGTDDGQIPPGLPERWADNARRQGDEVGVVKLAGADHFDVVDPTSKAWPQIRAAILKMVRG